MGPNLTEKALQRAARSVTALNAITERFDVQSGVPHRSSSKPDTQDVMAIVFKHKLLTQLGHREHRTFPGIALNPLDQIVKKKEYLKYKGKFRADVSD